LPIDNYRWQLFYYFFSDSLLPLIIAVGSCFINFLLIRKIIIKQLAKQLSMREVNQQKNNKTTGKAIINGRSESTKK
jgi:type III secretory pathway component EscR